MAIDFARFSDLVDKFSVLFRYFRNHVRSADDLARGERQQVGCALMTLFADPLGCLLYFFFKRGRKYGELAGNFFAVGIPIKCNCFIKMNARNSDQLVQLDFFRAFRLR